MYVPIYLSMYTLQMHEIFKLKGTNTQTDHLPQQKAHPHQLKRIIINQPTQSQCLHQARPRDSIFSWITCQPSHESRGLHWPMKQKLAIRGRERWPSSCPAKPGLLCPNAKPPFGRWPAPSLMLYYRTTLQVHQLLRWYHLGFDCTKCRDLPLPSFVWKRLAAGTSPQNAVPMLKGGLLQTFQVEYRTLRLIVS